MTRLFGKSIAIAVVAIWSAACAQTDAGITTAIKSQLAADDEVKAYQIDVDTRDKTVTLSGTVDTTRAKTRAAEIARLQKGVFQVIDNVTVTAASPAVMSDEVLTSRVKEKLIGNATVSGLKIEIETRDAVVTLSGEVYSQAQRDAAVRLARETTGVREVIDQLKVVAS